MIDNSNANVKLTFEQLQQIDVAEKKLRNLQNEYQVSLKLLGEVRLDTERVTKEKLYQESLLKDLTDKTKTASDTLSSLELAVKESTAALETNRLQAQEAKESNLEKERELTLKEQQLSSKELELQKSIEVFNNEVIMFKENKKKVDDFKEELHRVLQKEV